MYDRAIFLVKISIDFHYQIWLYIRGDIAFPGAVVDTNNLINLNAYPIDQDGAARDELIHSVRAQLHDDGCAVLKNFLTPYAVACLVKEADQVAHLAHRSHSRTNPYFTKDDPSLPQDDPRRRFFDRSNAFIPADNFAPSGALRQIQNFPAFDPFIKDCLEQVVEASCSERLCHPFVSA